MTSLLRLEALRERLRSSLWLWPAIAVTAAAAAGVLLPMLEGGSEGVGFAGSPDGARAVLGAVAGSMITVTGLTFSLTVVALQMASSQFTPRLMRTFLADGGNQAVLSVFLGTFAYTLTVLRSIRNPIDEQSAFVPDIAVAVGLALTALSVAMLVFFIHHLTQQLRVESVLAEVLADTLSLVRTQLPLAEEGVGPEPIPDVPEGAVVLTVRKSGYLQAADESILRSLAEELGILIRLRPSVGVHVIAGSTLGWAWPVPGARELRDELPEEEALSRRVHNGIQIGRERTLQQDVAFGLRQLVDIAARALSPGINDPTTAVAALHSLGDVMAALSGRRLGPTISRGEGGSAVVVPRPTYAELLALACDQPRRYGKDEPAVLTELLRVLTDLAEVAQGEDEREALRHQIDTTVEAARAVDLSRAEQRHVQDLAGHARDAVDTGVRSAAIPDGDGEPAS